MDGKLFNQLLLLLFYFPIEKNLITFNAKTPFFHPLYEAHELCLFSGKMFFFCRLLTHQNRKLRAILLQKKNASELMSEQRRAKVRTYFQENRHTHTKSGPRAALHWNREGRFLCSDPMGAFEAALHSLPDFPSKVGVLSCLDCMIKQEL